MKSIRISDKTYNFLKRKSDKECRSLSGTLDYFVSIFEEEECEQLAGKSLSYADREGKEPQLVKDKKKYLKKG